MIEQHFKSLNLNENKAYTRDIEVQGNYFVNHLKSNNVVRKCGSLVKAKPDTCSLEMHQNSLKKFNLKGTPFKLVKKQFENLVKKFMFPKKHIIARKQSLKLAINKQNVNFWKIIKNQKTY